jgi:hypothetical protein
MTATIRAQASNQDLDLPISIIDGASPPQLQREDQQNATVVALPDKNQWLVIWEDWRNWASTGADIYGRFIDKNGNYCGPEFILCNQPGNQTSPTLAYRPTNTVLVAWQDSRGTTSDGYIYYRTIDVSLLDTNGYGYTLAGETAVTYTSIDGDYLDSRKHPDAAYNTARDQFWLAWIESRDTLQRIGEDPFGVYSSSAVWSIGDTNYIAYAIISGGTPTSNQTDIIRNNSQRSNSTCRRISSSSTSDDSKTEYIYEYEYFTRANNVKVSCDEQTRDTLLVWEGIRGKATLTCTRERNEEEVETPGLGGTTTTQTLVTYTYPPTTLELSSWEGDEDNSNIHIYTLFDKNINQAVVHAQQLDAQGNGSHYPNVAFEPVNSKFMVTWEAQQENGFSKIYGQLLFSGGGTYGSNLLLSFQDTDGDGVQDDDILLSNQTHPTIAVDNTNQLFLVTWQDGRRSQVSTENLDIYGQFIDCEGSMRGNNYAINISGANQCNPQTAYNRGNHKFFMVWKDARNFIDTHSDIYGQKFDLEDLQVYNNGQAATQIILTDTGSNGTLSPLHLGFPTLVADNSVTRNITVKNTSADIMVVESFDTTTKEFSINDLEAGDEIPAGGSLTFSVSFSPIHLGNFTDTLSLAFGSQTEGLIIPCSVNLSGKAIGKYILKEADSFSADRNYQLNVNAFTEQSGHLYVLLIHNPISGSIVYALTPTGNLVPFPYTSPFGWQNLFYANQSSPSLVVGLNTLNYQELGCTMCLGPTGTTNGNDSFTFGNTITIQPPNDTPYNGATDFKYLAGDLYIATYIADGIPGAGFDFNRGLVELLRLTINSLNGNWRVASEYDGELRVHSALLQVQENNGVIAAQWGDYLPVINYSLTESAYIIQFTLAGYQYTYTINQLTDDSFSGFYHCEANGTVIIDQAPVNGVRVQ